MADWMKRFSSNYRAEKERKVNVGAGMVGAGMLTGGNREKR